MLRKIVLFIFVVGFSTSLIAHDKSWPGRRLAKSWPEAKKFVKVQKRLKPTQIKRIENVLGAKTFTEDRSPAFYYAYKTHEKKPLLGLILFVDAYGKNGRMEISVGINNKGEIEKILVWEHSEKRFIESDAFIGSFIGKTMFDSLTPHLKKNPLPKKTVNAFVSAIHRGLLITTESFGTNINNALKEFKEKKEKAKEAMQVKKEDAIGVKKDMGNDDPDDHDDHNHHH